MASYHMLLGDFLCTLLSMDTTNWFHNAPEVWDKAKCEKLANKTEKDGLGTPYPFKGYIGYLKKTTRYNGGIIRDGEWYPGEVCPLPIVADGFEIIDYATWGLRIRKLVP